MGTRQTQDAIKVIIARTDPRQVLLAEYLRSTGKITAQLMASADACLYSYAVAAKSGSSDAEVELAMAESVIALSSQINRILNFHRIDRQIILPNEVLTRCGLIPRSEPVMSPEQSVAIAPPLPTVSVTAPQPTVAVMDDSEEDRPTHAGLKLSSSVASFLYGET